MHSCVASIIETRWTSTQISLPMQNYARASKAKESIAACVQVELELQEICLFRPVSALSLALTLASDFLSENRLWH